ncbi:MAG TPA: AzlC family ABC transporter permease [Beijerinckiaceae bacterium]
MARPPMGPEEPSTRALVLRGVRDALALPAWVVGLSMFAVGSLAGETGFPAGAAVLSTLMIWAGPAQVIFFGGIAVGTALPAIALAVALSSIRLLPMTLSTLPLFGGRAKGTGLQVLVAHYVTVTVWVEALRLLPPMPMEERLPYYLGFANACLLLCAVTTFFGYALVGALPLPLAAGLLFLTPTFFTLSLAAGARGASDWVAVGAGFVLAPVSTALVGKDFDLLLVGLVGGTAAYLVQKKLGRGPA